MREEINTESFSTVDTNQEQTYDSESLAQEAFAKEYEQARDAVLTTGKIARPERGGSSQFLEIPPINMQPDSGNHQKPPHLNRADAHRAEGQTGQPNSHGEGIARALAEAARLNEKGNLKPGGRQAGIPNLNLADKPNAEGRLNSEASPNAESIPNAEAAGRGSRARIQAERHAGEPGQDKPAATRPNPNAIDRTDKLQPLIKESDIGGLKLERQGQSIQRNRGDAYLNKDLQLSRKDK